MSRAVARIYCEYSMEPDHEELSKRADIGGITPRYVTNVLALPAAVISVSAWILIPWLIETRNRLQNDYWERQIGFAIGALIIVSAGLPALVLRVLCSNRVVAIGVWLVLLSGYFAVFVYISQSHFPLLVRMAIGSASAGLGYMAIKALKADWARNRPAGDLPDDHHESSRPD